MPDDDGIPDMADMAEALEAAAKYLESHPAPALVTGYKAKMIALGFSEKAAEAMAVDFHHVLLRSDDDG